MLRGFTGALVKGSEKPLLWRGVGGMGGMWAAHGMAAIDVVPLTTPGSSGYFLKPHNKSALS